ncbi:MAG: hypothetical protein FJZ67_06710 [Bacteroidetes bacterium]|nr:hypothetical protein [Bacteroidota bacterium]
MKTYEIINNHEGTIFFYPFCGTHFEIIKPLNDAISGLNKKILYVYCSIGGTQDEFENWGINNPLARGLHTDVNFIENKLGLKNFEIESYQKLTDFNVDASYYTFYNAELIFIKGEAFEFTDYLQNEGIDLLKMNLILSFALGFDDVLKSLILKFHLPNSNNRYVPKMIVINNHYLNNVKELFLKTNSYQIQTEFEEKVGRNHSEKYSILFEEGIDDATVKMFRFI